MDLAHKKGKSLRVEIILDILPFTAATIKKDIFLPGMSMHINEHSHILLLTLSKDHLLKVVNFRVMLLTWVFPSSIEVYP